MLPESAERRVWTGKRGSMEFIKPRPLVGVIVFEGRVTDDAAAAWHDHFEWLTEHQGVHLFLDGGELVHAGMRMAATGIALVARAQSRIAAAHVLVRNSYIEVIADAANLSFGGYMQMHRDRAAFEAELERALQA